jgi:hypothetical protein
LPVKSPTYDRLGVSLSHAALGVGRRWPGRRSHPRRMPNRCPERRSTANAAASSGPVPKVSSTRSRTAARSMPMCASALASRSTLPTRRRRARSTRVVTGLASARVRRHTWLKGKGQEKVLAADEVVKNPVRLALADDDDFARVGVEALERQTLLPYCGERSVWTLEDGTRWQPRSIPGCGLGPLPEAPGAPGGRAVRRSP